MAINMDHQKQALLPFEITGAKPEQILSRMLSTKSYTSTAAPDDTSQQRSMQIGKGQCGTIYALWGTLKVAKIPNSPEKVPQLLSDYKIHACILDAMSEVETAIRKDINIPDLHSWASPNSKAFWSDCGLRFPPDVDAQKFAMVSNRVLPVPLPVREALVDVLCPPAIQRQKQEFLAKPENKNCLIRIYLGRRATTKDKNNWRNIGLQNFPLHVNEMEHLQLDTSLFAQIMAQTLAIVHWKAGVDGNDIEFILGSSPLTIHRPMRDELARADEWSLGEHFQGDFSHRPDRWTATDPFNIDFTHRSISMWLIDFNQCTRFEDDEAGLKKIVDAFFWNDPYYPRPNSKNDEDEKLWVVFSKRYLEVSSMFTNSKTPQLFISKIEEQSKKGSIGGLFEL